MSVDRNVDAVMQRMEFRASVGLMKYGVTTERDDISDRQWLRHLQEELMDAVVYIERVLSAEEVQP